MDEPKIVKTKTQLDFHSRYPDVSELDLESRGLVFENEILKIYHGIDGLVDKAYIAKKTKTMYVFIAHENEYAELIKADYKITTSYVALYSYTNSTADSIKRDIIRNLFNELEYPRDWVVSPLYGNSVLHLKKKNEKER